MAYTTRAKSESHCIAVRDKSWIANCEKMRSTVSFSMMSFTSVCRDPYCIADAPGVEFIQFFRQHVPEQQCQGYIVHHAGGGEFVRLLEALHGGQGLFIKGGSVILWREITADDQRVLDEFHCRSLITELNKASAFLLPALAGDFCGSADGKCAYQHDDCKKTTQRALSFLCTQYIRGTVTCKEKNLEISLKKVKKGVDISGCLW